jgi:hypothetical protein
MYFLIDANIAAGYYLPRSLRSIKARNRIEKILNYIRSNNKDNFIYIPNFCIAETFSVFTKNSFGLWNKQLKNKKALDSRVYESLVNSFQKDVHNGSFFYHYELNRYHILNTNLVSPVDHHYKISQSRKYKISPAGTFDHLIISMGIELSYIHGSENVCILSTDKRLIDVLKRCKSAISENVIKKLKFNIAEKVCGKKMSKNIFPLHLDLARCKDSDIKNIFGEEVFCNNKKPKGIYRYLGD